MSSAAGPTRRALPRRWSLARRDALVEIEEMRALPRLHRRLPEEPVQRGLGRRPAAEADDRRMHRRRVGKLAQRDRDVAGQQAAHADVDRPVDHHDVARPRQRLPQRSAGNGRKATRVTRPIATPSARISSITSLIVPLTEPIATTRISASSASVGPQQAAGCAAEALLELDREPLDQGERRVLLVILQVAHFGEGVRPDHRADRDRIGRDRGSASARRAAGMRRPPPGRECRCARRRG